MGERRTGSRAIDSNTQRGRKVRRGAVRHQMPFMRALPSGGSAIESPNQKFPRLIRLA